MREGWEVFYRLSCGVWGPQQGLPSLSPWRSDELGVENKGHNTGFTEYSRKVQNNGSNVGPWKTKSIRRHGYLDLSMERFKTSQILAFETGDAFTTSLNVNTEFLHPNQNRCDFSLWVSTANWMNALDMVTRKFKLICEWEDVVQLDPGWNISENWAEHQKVNEVRASKGETVRFMFSNTVALTQHRLFCRS